MGKLEDWKEKYYRSLTAYSDRRTAFSRQQDQYEGKRQHEGTGGQAPKALWNFTKELIESQIESTIPMPKVECASTSEKKKERAAIIEAMLRSELKRLNFVELNDQDERTTKIMGGNFLLTEWDNSIVTKESIGAVRQKLINPLQLIPQDGVHEIEDMDYIFLTFEETKERIKSRYGKNVEDESVDPTTADTPTADETVTQVLCFYKNKKGGVGCFSWAGDTVLVNDEHYNARGEKACAKCGQTKPIGEKTCRCGSSQWEKRDLENEEIEQDISNSFGEVIPAMVYARDENGDFALEEYEEPVIDTYTGIPVFERQFDDRMNVIGETPIMETLQRHYQVPNKIPYYIPRKFPVSVRNNISLQGQLLGDSDCETIWLLQDSANKVLSKMDKKAINAGSILAIPDDILFNPSNADLQVLSIQTTEQLSRLKAINMQFDAQQELALVQSYYDKAKSALGVTDSFQGKADSTAMSGKAKEIQVMQSGGRLASKREMKKHFYARVFESIFQYNLAYSDEPRTYVGTGDQGEEIEKVFNRYDFLDQDEYGNWYYDDDFTFGIDETGSMFADKETQMEDIRTDYGMGAYGDPNDPQTKLQYWKAKETLKYPNAKQMVSYWTTKVEEFQAMQAQHAQMQQALMGMPMQGVQPIPGGDIDAMPQM